MILNPADIGADFDSAMGSNFLKLEINNESNQVNNDNSHQNTHQRTETKTDESQNSEDPQYLADLNLFMNSTKEKSEEELQRIEKRLVYLQRNMQNIHK